MDYRPLGEEAAIDRGSPWKRPPGLGDPHGPPGHDFCRHNL
jgi:hypothetical protein